jgi:hypothetical protein
MRYLVKARVKSGKDRALVGAVDQGTLGRGSIAGDEYLGQHARGAGDIRNRQKVAKTCFCDPPPPRKVRLGSI